MNIDTLT